MLKTSPDVVHDLENHSFLVRIDPHVAVLDYFLNHDTITFTHTGVPTALEGRGIGSALVKAGLKYARENGLKVQSLCWFVDKYRSRHPEE